MRKIRFVKCPQCQKEYHLDKTLSDLDISTVKLMCPFCKHRFYPTADKGAGST